MMDVMPLSPDWVHALAWTLLHFLWQGALVGAAFGAGRALLEQAAPRHRYALGLAALALLALLPALTLWRLAPGASSALHFGVAGGGAGHESWLNWLVLLWAAGAALSASRVVRQYLGLRALVRSQAESLNEWVPLLRQVAQRVGVSRPVRLLRSALVQTPCVLGWLTPVIVLPAGVLSGLTAVEVELLLAHELCHLRRGDYLVNLVQLALEALLFYHPVVHWISREVRNEREACCDALVLDLGADPIAYARTLARLEELRADELAPALAASGGELLMRIRRILHVEKLASVSPAGAGPALMPLLITAALAVAPFAGATHAPTAARAAPVAVLDASALRAPIISGLQSIPAPAAPPIADVSLARPRSMLSTRSARRVVPAPAPATRAERSAPVPSELALGLARAERPLALPLEVSDLRFAQVDIAYEAAAEVDTSVAADTNTGAETETESKLTTETDDCLYSLGSHLCRRIAVSSKFSAAARGGMASTGEIRQPKQVMFKANSQAGGNAPGATRANAPIETHFSGSARVPVARSVQ